jgi:hypothetical protein
MQADVKTDRREMFEWDKVPGVDERQLKNQLKRSPFNMEWVDDAEFTKSDNNKTINITDTTTANRSAKIVLSADNESAELTRDDGKIFDLEVENKHNKLYIYYIQLLKVTDVVSGEGFVMVDELDSGMHIREHGSGIYYSEEVFVPKEIYKKTYGEYKPTYFVFSDSFVVNFSSLWMHDICVKDEKRGTAIHKKISDASFIADDTTVTKSSSSKRSESSMNFSSSFNGSMHIGVRTGAIRISEDYIGEFKVTEVIEIVKEKPTKKTSKAPDWLSCPYPISSSTYPWVFDQYTIPTHHWICPSMAP